MTNLPYISPDLVSQYQSHLASTGAQATAKRRVSSLKKFFDWAHKEGHVTQNPFVVSTAEPIKKQTGKKISNSIKISLVLGGCVGMAVFAFLLVKRLGTQIPFRLAPALEPSSSIQIGTPKPSAVGEKQSTDLGPIASVSPWILYTKLNFKEEAGEPITSVQSITFSLFPDQESTSPLWTSTAQEVIPDSEGNVRLILKDVPTNLFFENETLFLQANLPQGVVAQRIPVPTASSNTGSQTAFLGEDGNLLLAGEAPSVVAESGNLLIEGQTVTIKTADASDGNIEINPDGTGYAHFLFEGTGQNFLNAQAPNLTRGSLYYGIVANNSTGYDLIRLQNGSKATTRFAVDADGDISATGNLAIGGGVSTGGLERLTSSGALTNITGYSQNSGNFSITQGAGDTATITKKESALADLLTLTLDERGKPNSNYSTLTLKRYNGGPEAYALFVDEGNARFDSQLQLGRFSSNPSTGIGEGSLIYNSTDDTVYAWDGSTWNTISGGSSALIIQEADTTVAAAADTIDFLGGDFDISESPANEANVQLASILTTPTAVAGDFSINGGDLTTTQTIATLFNTTAATLSVGGAATTFNLGATDSITRTINLGTGSGADTVNIGTGITTADTITIGNSVSGTTVAITSGTGTNSWNISAVGAATFGGHVTLSSDSSEGLSGGGLSDCDTASTSKLLWDATTNKFSCGTDSDTGASTTLQSAYDAGNTILTDATGDIIFRVIGGATDTQFEVNAASVPEIDIVNITNAGQGTVTDGVDGIGLTFVTGNPGAASTNSGLNLILTSAGDAADEILQGINLALTGTSGTERGINFADNNFDTDINAVTDLTLGIGGTNEVILTSSAFSPTTSDSNALGTGTLMWSDLFLASDAVINFNNGDVTLTHAANSLSIAGGDFNVEIIDGQTVNIDGDGSPTTDILTLGASDTSATDGVDALQITFAADDASGNLIDLSPTFTDNDAGNNAETWNVIDVDSLTVTQNDSGGAITGTVRGLNIGDLTESATGDDAITSTALNIGTGWDTILGGTTAGTNLFSFTNASLTTAGLLTIAGDLAVNGDDITSDGTLTITPTTTLTLNSTGDMTLDSSTDIVFDADGADLVFKDGGTTVATFTNSSTDLTLDIVGGQFYLADTDVFNVGGLTAVAYNALANSGEAPEQAAIAADNDLYVGGDVEIDGGLYLDFTTGSVIFAGASGELAQDNANFFWDNSTNFLGLGNNAPTTQLHIGSNAETHSLGASDVLISSDLELDGILYLDGRTISNPVGTVALLLPTDPSTTTAYLTASSWTVNNTATTTGAALSVDQDMSGDIFYGAGGLGSELITNTTDRDFSGAGNWTGTNWAVSGGTFLHTAGTTDDAVLANSNLTSGAIDTGGIYRLVFTVSGQTLGTLTPKLGTAAGTAVSSNATFTQDITANSGTPNLIFTPSSNFDGAIDNISVKRLLDFAIHNDGSITLTSGLSSTSNTTEGTIFYDNDSVGSAATDHLFLRGSDDAWHRIALDMTKYSASDSAVANQGYIEIAHNQNTNDLGISGWFFDTISGLWKQITSFASNIVHDLDNEFNPSFTQKQKVETVKIQYNENNLGNGADGAATFSSDTNINISSGVGRTCADAVNYSVSSLTSTTATVESNPSGTCLTAGDEILLINLRGTSSAYTNVGNYETLKISSISTNVVTFTTSKTKYYGDGASDDTNIGLGTGNQAVMLQRVPNYTSVTVSTANTDLTPSEWTVPSGSADANTETSATGAGEGGVLFFRATGTVSVAASTTINANGTGYIGGTGTRIGGESFCGAGGASGSAGAGGGGGGTSQAGGNGLCGGGGGGGFASGIGGVGSASLGGAGGAGGRGNSALNGGAGGGGGYGTLGAGGEGISGATNGANGGTNQSGNGGNSTSTSHGGGGGGGGTYGDAPLADLLFGSPGGAGGSNVDPDAVDNGGDGGGIVYIAASTITVSGGITTTGANGAETGTGTGGGGGGGAGGSIKLVGNTLTLGSTLVTAAGGTGSTQGSTGGNGGSGRIAAYYANAISGSTSPSAESASVPNSPYTVFISDEVPTPNAAFYDKVNWLADENSYGMVQLQTRSGNTSNSTDGTWEAWKSGRGFDVDTAGTLTTSLISYWPFDEFSNGGVQTNRSDAYSTNTLTDNATTASGTGKKINGADFESGNSEFFEIADNAALSTGDIDFTVSAWANLESTGANRTILSKSDSSSVGEYELYYNNSSSKFEFILRNSSGTTVCTATDTTTVSTSTWYNLVAWHDASGNTCNIQVNNNTATSAAESGTVSDSAANFRVGARYTTEELFFDGIIDEAGFWKKVLSSAERASLYNDGNGDTYNEATSRSLQNMNTHTDWSGTGLNVADGDVTRNIDEFEDEDESTAGNLTKLYSSGFQTDTAGTLTTSLVSYWPLNETGGDRSDAYASETLTDNATVLSGTGKISNAADFESTNDEYLSHTDDAALSTGDIDFTIGAWVNMESQGASVQGIVNKGAVGTSQEYNLNYTGTGTDKFEFVLTASGTTICTATTTSTIATATWYFILAWHDATANTCNISIDNGTADSAAESGTLLDTAHPFEIGRFGASAVSDFDGLIDEVGFWKKVLSSTEKTDLYNSGNANTYPTSGQYAEATISSIDLTNYDYVTAWVRASQTGNTVKLGMGESAATEQTETFYIDTADVWQKVYWDITDIPYDQLDAITKLRVTNLSSSANTIYVDNITADRYLNNSAGSTITSTPNDYIQYRAILTTTNTAYRPKLHNVQIEWNDGYKIQQTDANTVRLYNFSGETQQLRLDAIVFGADLAEWYTIDDPSIEPGDVVALTGQMDNFGVPILRKVNQINDPAVVGAISTKAGQALGVEKENRRLLGLAGRIPVKIDPSSAPIMAGDLLTTSLAPGTARKAASGDTTIGKAFEAWVPEMGKNQVLMFIDNTIAPEPTTSQSRVYRIAYDAVSGTIEIFDETTQVVVDKVGAYSILIAGNISAGTIQTVNFVADNIVAGVGQIDNLTTTTLTAATATVDNLLINSGLVSPVVQTGLISPLPDGTDVTVQIGSEATPSGKLAIQNAQGEKVASIDSQGNAEFDGTVTSNEIHTGKIYADEIIARNGTISDLSTASSSAITREEIEAILAEVEDNQTLLFDASNWDVKTATGSGVIDEAAIGNLYVTEQATVNFLSASNSIAVGSDFVIQSLLSADPATNNQLLSTSIDTLTAPLSLQSLALAPVEIMAGKVRIETNGDVYIDANLYVAGNVEAKSLTINPAEDGSVSAAIDASGSATFKSLTTDQLIIAGTEVSTASAIVNGEIQTNATVGIAQIEAGISEITIRNPKITDYTLIYVTPTSPTENKTLYVKSKTAGYFTVGFSSPISVNATFNWWIIESQ